MKGQVALVKEQGVRFAVVVVKQSTLQGPKHSKDESVAAFSTHFGIPAVLMAQDSRGRATTTVARTSCASSRIST